MLTVERQGRAQIRSKNKVRVFKTLAINGARSRTQLEKELSLSGPSITRIVDELLQEGLICETISHQTAVGRRPVMLEAKAEAFYTCGISMKRSEITLCVMDMQMKARYQATVDISNMTTSEDYESAFSNMLCAAKEALAVPTAQWLGVGVAARGIVDSKRGVVHRFIEGAADLNLADIIKREIGCFWYVENNIIADIEYEYIDNAQTPEENLLYLFVEEGVGCSIISNGQIILGSSFFSGKLAHLVVEPNGRRCSCGKRGHLESYVTASAIEADYRAAGGDATENLAQICAKAAQGEAIAQQVVQRVIELLSGVLLQLVTVLNPAKVVLYGTIFEEYETASTQIACFISENVFHPALSPVQWDVRKSKTFKSERNVARVVIGRALSEKLSN